MFTIFDLYNAKASDIGHSLVGQKPLSENMYF